MSPPWAKTFWGKNSQGCRRLVKAPKASCGPRKVPGTQGGLGSERGREGARGGEAEQGKQGPWVWLKTQGCQRLPKACECSQGFLRPQEGPRDPGRPREVQGATGSKRGWGGATEARPLSLTEDSRLPKACEGSQGFLRPQEPREAQGGSGSERGWGEQGKQGPWVWLKTQGCQRLVKAFKASWGPRKVEGPREA